MSWELRSAIFADPSTERLYVGPKSLGVLEPVPVPTIVGAPQDLRSLVSLGFFGQTAFSTVPMAQVDLRNKSR